MKKIIIYSVIANLFIISLSAYGASGVSTTSKNRVEGTMQKTTSSIKQSNLKLKEELLLQENENKNENLRKTLEDFRSKIQPKTLGKEKASENTVGTQN